MKGTAAKRKTFQEKLLSDLKAKPFQELAGLPERQSMKVPAALSDWTFVVHRQRKGSNQVEMVVEATKELPPGGDMLTHLKYVRRFSMSRDGKITEDSVRIDD